MTNFKIFFGSVGLISSDVHYGILKVPNSFGRFGSYRLTFTKDESMFPCFLDAIYRVHFLPSSQDDISESSGLL